MTKLRIGLFAIAVLSLLALAATTQVDFNNQIKNTPQIQPQAFNFTPQLPGGSLASGNNTITMSPVPKGVNGTDTNHPLYISNGTGTAEACTINGGSGTSGQSSGSIIINCANTHTGAWTIQSATAGAREALVFGGAGITLFFPPATYGFQGTLTVDNANVHLTGARGSLLQAAANANLTYLIQTTNSATGFILSNLTLDGNRSNSGTKQNPGAAGNARNLFAVLQIGGVHSTVNTAEIKGAQVNAITLQDATTAPSDFKLLGSYIHDNGGTVNSSGWGTGIYMGNPSTTITGVQIVGNRFENNNNTVTGAGPSAAVSGFNTNDVVVSGNYAKNNFNAIGGQYVTGGTTGTNCSSNDTNWTVTGNTAILTTHSLSDLTFGIEVCGQLQTVAGNTLIGNDQGGILTDAGTTDVTVTGNYVDGNGNKYTPSASAGLSLGGITSFPTLRVVASGNTFKNYDWGILVEFSTDDFISLRGNVLTSDTTPISDLSTQSHMFISENLGFNPQAGATGAITVTASPFTYTAGHIPENIAITGGTTTHISINGGDMCTVTPCFFRLEPNQSTTVTYSGTPTMVKTIE